MALKVGGEVASAATFGPGAVLDLAEADYMYGLGRLALKVEKIGADPAQYRALEWVFLIGRELYWDGRFGDERYATVRVSAIDGALRPPGWRPTEGYR